MQVSKDILRKQHEYNKQSSSTNLILSIFFGLLFSLNNTQIDSNLVNVVVGLFLLILLHSNIKDNYVGDLYESRIVNENTQDPYEKVLIEIKRLDSEPNCKKYKVWLKSYFGFGFRNYWKILLGHLVLFGLSIWLIIKPLIN